MLSRFLKSSFQIAHLNKQYNCYRSISSLSAVCHSNKTDYKDVTKGHGVIYGSRLMRQLLQEHVGAKSFWLENLQELHNIYSERAQTQNELVPRSMGDSVQEVLIPIGSDLAQRDKYLTFFNTVRIGKLLEDLDTLSGWVGFKYFKGPTERPPFSLVTACVDRISVMDDRIAATEDMKLTCFVSWAGTTSLEITNHIEQFDPNTNSWRQIAEAVFVMVARSLKDGSATVINKIISTTEEEKRYFEQGEANKILRKKKKGESLFKTPPTSKENDVIHQLFTKTLDSSKSTFARRVKPENTKWMEETRLKNLLICHPQSRNLYNKIFGGFLMREAYELAWANTCVHIQSKPTFIAMNDVVFRKPVEVGSLLYLSSQIVFTKYNYLQTRVNAEVVDPKTGNVDTTNVFYFHFKSKKEFKQVMPMSYGEYMLYLDGSRHAETLTDLMSTTTP